MIRVFKQLDQFNVGSAHKLITKLQERVSVTLEEQQVESSFPSCSFFLLLLTSI